MRNLDLEVVDNFPEKKTDLIEKYLIPGYSFSYTKFAIPAQIQGQINAIHKALTVLHGNLDGENQNLVTTAGAFLEGLEADLKNYRIEDQDLHL